MARILLIDDDQEFAASLAELLAGRGHLVRAVDSAEEALRVLSCAEKFHLLLLDNKLPRMSGLEFLTELVQRRLEAFVVLMTGSHSDHTAIQAMRLGARNYVLKPLDVAEMLPELEPVLREALEFVPPPPVQIQKGPPEEEREESTLVGRSKAMLGLLMRIGQLARLDETVLIRGETGTGKDLVARALHTNSPRKDKPFVVLNCGAFNENLLDDELFGHEIGAFTGAVKLRKGKFEHASGGTLFLDEVGDMPLALQVKLLRVLENREVVRLGGNEPIGVDVRVLAATHRDLLELVREGKFRQDLFFRLEGLRIDLPPLRERNGDIELLARTFLARMFPERGSRPALHPQAVQRLRGYRWPGNVRQLHKVLCRAAGTCRGLHILPEDIDFGELAREEAPAPPSEAGEASASQALHSALRRMVEEAWQSGQEELWQALQDRLERELLAFALAQPGGSQVKVAERLGVSRNYLRKRIKELGFSELPVGG